MHALWETSARLVAIEDVPILPCPYDEPIVRMRFDLALLDHVLGTGEVAELEDVPTFWRKWSARQERSTLQAKWFERHSRLHLLVERLDRRSNKS